MEGGLKVDLKMGGLVAWKLLKPLLQNGHVGVPRVRTAAVRGAVWGGSHQPVFGQGREREVEVMEKAHMTSKMRQKHGKLMVGQVVKRMMHQKP